jgi:uncharacterized protein
LALGVAADRLEGDTQEWRSMKFLNVPGYSDSGPDHWQTLWESAFPSFARVQQDDWDHPERGSWVRRLDHAVAAAGEVVLVAHSLGCATVAHWARGEEPGQVRAAFLVAPADVERPGFLPDAVGFSPLPLDPLPFPSLVVASEDDEYLSPRRARHLAAAWGSQLVTVGRRGHINSASGLGAWQEGQAILSQFLEALGLPPPAGRRSRSWSVRSSGAAPRRENEA